MTVNVAEFNPGPTGVDSYLRKAMPAASVYQIAAVFVVPATTIAALLAAGKNCTWSYIVLEGGLGPTQDGDEIYCCDGIFGGIYKFQNDFSGLRIHDLVGDVQFTINLTLTYVSGNNWNTDWNVDGGTTASGTGIDMGQNNSVPFEMVFGCEYPNVGPTEQICYLYSVDVLADSVPVFSDDFSSGDLSGWDDVVGDVRVVTPLTPSATYHSPEWRFVVGDLQSFEVLSFLDKLSSQKVATFTLNQAAVAEGVVPSDNPEVNIPWPSIDDDPFLTEGSRVLWGLRKEGTPKVWVIRFAGIIMQLEDTAQSDNAYSHYTAFDPWQYLLSRPVCNADGTLPGPGGISYSSTRVDVIAAELLGNTILNQGQVGIDAGAMYGGTGFYDGTIDAPDMIDINFQQGTSVGQAWTQLCNLDVCDIVLLPIYDPKNRPGYLCQFNIASQWGSDKDDQIFAWDRPSRSLVGLQRTISGTERANVVQFFAGQGGSAGTATEESDSASIAKFGEYWRQQFFPNQIEPFAVQALAQAQLDLSKNGRTTVVFSPAPERSPIPFTDYYLGDRVRVYASNRFRAPIPSPGLGSSNQQNYERVYGIPVQIADDATETIQQMLTVIPTS